MSFNFLSSSRPSGMIFKFEKGRIFLLNLMVRFNRRLSCPNFWYNFSYFLFFLHFIFLKISQPWFFYFINKSLTLAPIILSSTNIAEFVLASTSHMVTTIILFHPKFTARTLLILSSFDAYQKVSIFFTQVSHLLVFLTGQICVELTFACQTVMLFTSRTAIVCKILIESKDSTAAWSGTPTGILHVLLYIVVEGELFVFVSYLSVEKLRQLIRG